MKQWASRAWPGVLLAFALLAGCAAAQPLPSATPTPTPPGVRVTRLATIPDVHVPSGLAPVAGTGTRFLIEGEPARYTLDNGRIWQDAPAELRAYSGRGTLPLYGSFIGYGGIFLGVRQEPEPSYAYTGFQRWDPATGEVTTLDYDLDVVEEGDSDDDTPVFPIDYIGGLVLLNDSRIFDVSGSRALPVEPRLPDATVLGKVRWSGLSRNGRYAVGLADGAEGTQLVVGALTPDAVATSVTVPGLLAVDVSADRIHYLVGGIDQLRVCRAEAASPADAGCVVLADGDYATWLYEADLTTSDGATQVSLFSEDGEVVRYWFVRGNRVALLSTDSADWDWLPYRDAAAPMARQGGVAVTISDSGNATALFAAPAEAAAARSPAVAADRVVYLQEAVTPGRSTWPVWARTIAEGGLGEPTVLVDRTVIAPYVSGDRTAVQWDSAFEDGVADLVFYDGVTETGRVTPGSGSGLRGLSGPYARLSGGKAGARVVRVDGREYRTGPVLAVFGSLVVEASAPQEEAGRSFVLRDLARPDAEPLPIDLPDAAGATYGNDNWRIWGEWLSATRQTHTSNVTVVLNHRTGDSWQLPEKSWVLALGDGWVLLTDGQQVRLRVLATGEEVVVADELVDIATDGIRTLAWSGAQGGVVATIEGLDAPVPRLLGTLRMSKLRADGEHAWTPEFDLTGPAGPGTLQVADAAGVVVASLPVDASTSGSIRGLRWDGRDAAGELVEPGRYTWTLDVDGATSVDGLRPASGPLTVTR